MAMLGWASKISLNNVDPLRGELTIKMGDTDALAIYCPKPSVG